MTKILITGGAGFIGSNFIRSIAARKNDYKFYVIDALTYAGKIENIQDILDTNEHIHFEKMDIRDQDLINELFQKESFDGIIHFAAESHVDNSIKNPNIFVETNVLGTLNLLNAAREIAKTKPFRFLHISTDEVYGTLKEDDPAFTEEDIIKPNSPYSASKASSDLLVKSYFETYGLDVVITRCSNNYGPYQLNEKLIPLMIEYALKNKQLPVYGDGRNIRDWIYVDDHNSGVWKVYTDGRSGEVYNLGGKSEKRNLEVVKTLLDTLQKPHSLISFVEDRLGHDWRYAIDFSKTEKELDWRPTVSFEEGIKKTINWYLERLS